MISSDATWRMASFASVTAPPRVARENRVFTASLALFDLLLLALSPFALTKLGIGYADAGSNALAKFHPSTYYICALAILAAFATGSPISATLDALSDASSVIFLLLAIGIGVLHAAFISQHPITPLIDTFVPAMLTLLLLRRVPERRGHTLALLLHAFMCFNAALGIFEVLSGWRLTPLVLAGEELTYEWRASALLGHPLANSMLTGCYLLILAFGGGRDLPPVLRLASFALCFASMGVFGGRAATVLLIAILAVMTGLGALAFLNGRRVSIPTLLLCLAGLPLGGAALFALFSTNFADRFLQRFTDDAGSADARSEMFEVFNHISFPDLIFGPDPRLVATWQSLLGLERGIESFWLGMVLLYGLAVSALIFIALFFFCRDVAARCRTGAGWVFVYFIAVASASTSLAGKTSLLTIATLLLLVLMRPLPPVAANVPISAPRRGIAPGKRRA